MGKGKEMITLRELKEKAVSKQQQKLMGLALAYKRGEAEDSEVSDTVKDLAKSMSTKELEDFASTKHKGLPQKKEDNEITNRSAAMKPQTYNDPKTGRKKVRMVPVNTNIVKTNDRVNEAFKKGDVVKVNLGPHKHLKHEVIHSFDDGTYNVKPYDLAPSKNRYPGGAVKVKSNQIKKLDEAKSSTGYELYHRDFSSAMQHAYKHAKAKLGVDVDPEEIDSKVASGPRKPSKGKTNSYRLLDKGGKKAIQVQVYGMDNGKYELNMYKESVNEEMDPTKHVSKKGDMYCVYNKDGEEVAKFDNKKDADAYAIKNHDKLMEYLEVGTDAIRKSYASMTPGQTNELTGTDKALAVGAVGALAYGAKKVKDRFDPVKVRDARKKRAEKRAERSDAQKELDRNRRDHMNYQKKLRDMRDRQNQQRNKK